MKKRIILIVFAVSVIAMFSGCSAKMDLEGDVTKKYSVPVTGIPLMPFSLYGETYVDLEVMKGTELEYARVGAKIKNTSPDMIMTGTMYLSLEGLATKGTDVIHIVPPSYLSKAVLLGTQALNPGEILNVTVNSDDFPQMKEAVKNGKCYIIVKNEGSMPVSLPLGYEISIYDIYFSATVTKNMSPLAPLGIYLF